MMTKIRNFLLLFLLGFCITHPAFMNREASFEQTYQISENIKNLGEYLKEQEYFENISGICHEEECFSIDIHDLNRSLSVVENKVIEHIKKDKGLEQALETSLKGFSITKILTR